MNYKNKIGIIIQARMGSTRLPGKVMLDLVGKPVLQHIVERCKKANVDEVIVATTTKKHDDKIIKFCKEKGIKFFRGSEDDVLSRYYECSKKFDLDAIIRITADCPLIDYEIINKIIKKYKEKRYDYISNVHKKRTFPIGLDTELFNRATLIELNKKAKDSLDREHVNEYLLRNINKYNTFLIKNKEDFSNMRWTLDVKEDYEFIKKIYEKLYDKKHKFLMNDVLKLLKKNKELFHINKKIKQYDPKKDKRIKIDNKFLGTNEPCFIIAEAGINHNGDIKTAKKMIDTAKECGVDAIKFQTFTAKDFINDKEEKYEYISQGKKVKESMLKMFERHQFKKKEWKELSDYCKKKDIIFFSTPQNPNNLEMLLELNMRVIKVGSDDLINLPLLNEYSKKGLPMMISTGMSYEEEIDEAVKVILKNKTKLAVLHCVSLYPTPKDSMNILKIKALKEKYPKLIIGYSDHSKGYKAAEISTAMESKIFEKHFTLDRNMLGPDHRFSANPKELKKIVNVIRETEIMMGEKELKPSDGEMGMRDIAHRSIVAKKNIKKGEKFSKENLEFKRPGTGIKPKMLKNIIKKKCLNNIKKNQLIKKEDFKK